MTFKRRNERKNNCCWLNVCLFSSMSKITEVNFEEFLETVSYIRIIYLITSKITFPELILAMISIYCGFFSRIAAKSFYVLQSISDHLKLMKICNVTQN